MRKLEICTCDPIGIQEARKGGADRIELCSALSEGGLTPSVALIQYAVPLISTNVLIRPRSGDFIYDTIELDVMEHDARIAMEAGANGIVTGILTEDGEVDKEACRRMLNQAADGDNTFHRAFDKVADPLKALEEIIELGFKRILTSGQAPTALEGVELIAELHRRAAGRIIIMAGAGVSPENAFKILSLSRADELHASARSFRHSSGRNFGEATMGSSDNSDGSRLATDSVKVSDIKKAIYLL